MAAPMAAEGPATAGVTITITAAGAVALEAVAEAEGEALADVVEEAGAVEEADAVEEEVPEAEAEPVAVRVAIDAEGTTDSEEEGVRTVTVAAAEGESPCEGAALEEALAVPLAAAAVGFAVPVARLDALAVLVGERVAEPECDDVGVAVPVARLDALAALDDELVLEAVAEKLLAVGTPPPPPRSSPPPCRQ